ncbi:MAG: OsmC family protein [Betaproteobacteria bacterium]
MSNNLEAIPFPIGFKVFESAHPSVLVNKADGITTVKVEARQMAHHQKEAITTEGIEGDIWRTASDEGVHLKGTDLAPFPLGYFNAGLQGDLFQSMLLLASQRNLEISAIKIKLINHYWLTGSFVLGTGHGHAEAPDIDIEIDSLAPQNELKELVNDAIQFSPAMDFLKRKLKNTFAIYINGRRRQVVGLRDSDEMNAADPFLTYPKMPIPCLPNPPIDLIQKLPSKVDGEPMLAPPSTNTKIMRDIYGVGIWQKGMPFAEIDTWLGLPGASHFSFKTAVNSDQSYPTGLTLIASGVTYCFMTQLSRYIENMKMPIDGIRVFQTNQFGIEGNLGRSFALDTHLYLNGTADDETCTKLLQISERTCYLHATAIDTLEPKVTIKFHH